MEFPKSDQDIGFTSRQVTHSITEAATVPALIENAGHDTKRRFVEFFTAQIRNKHTRRAYVRAVDRFCHWIDQRGLTRLADIEPTMIAFYVEELLDGYSKASVKQHLAAIRMMFDYFVTGGLLRQNPALSVKGPRLSIVKGNDPRPATTRCSALA
ncbi:integrase family protein [Rhodopirellula maiorica SM1]|uniref:Integrase family protein n=1 Tax=Rhodopirellula maiorica SM1 TaxID=1265738 RepID=M5S054_9BACT|nr:site-specific integrase [Rhodopirellula maiorica]EMI19554.1 integrase family protein [Rhodopirellula maiorica SM1]